MPLLSVVHICLLLLKLAYVVVLTSPGYVNNFARVGRQVERLGFGGDVSGAERGGDVTNTGTRDRHGDRFVKIYVNSNETLEHVRVWHLTITETHDTSHAQLNTVQIPSSTLLLLLLLLLLSASLYFSKRGPC